MRIALLGVSLAVLSLVGPLTPSLYAQPPTQTQPPVEVVFPGDAKFSEIESKFREKTKVSSWAEEFQKRQVLGQVRASNGITGTIFTEALGLMVLLANQVPYIVYGTISIPQGSKLAQRDFSGNYGIVVIADPFVAALLDTTNGNIGAFVTLPAQVATVPLFPFPVVTPLVGPLGIFQVLVSLITVSAPQAPPAPPSPQAPAPTCPQDLPNKSDVNVSLNAPATIATVSDAAKLFEIGVAPPHFLTVQSFAPSLQYSFTTAFFRRIGIIIGPGSQQIPLTPEIPFVLFATSGPKSACLQATPKLVNGVLTIVGTISTN
ncbi:MAG: hypothetical protein RMJ90_03335 [Candidatus Bipolaricaulota bacterium]|nr:hypothetical protein [Candidatus Bipolaricaulota bacterium]